METWLLGLDAWIIQDGNYPDFRVGQEAQFAVEFSVDGPAAPALAEPQADPRPVRWTAARQQRSASRADGAWALDSPPTYDFAAKIVRRDPWVIDFGFRAYAETLDTPLGDEGAVVSFSGSLGIDPFMYFERLAKDETVPPLIYTWRIDRIGRETARWIEKEPRYFVRDIANSAFVEVEETDAWEDDGGHASYILECVLLDVPRSRRSATAAYY